MPIIGLIAEYNPLHNGHLYQLKKIRELYPKSLIILVLNGYFLERGLVSYETKEEKTRLALKYGVDLVLELPFFFGSNSADTFAEAAIDILAHMHIDTLIFGSESNDIEALKKMALEQLDCHFNTQVKKYIDMGENYPTALNKALTITTKEPNDLLAISYIKAIIKNNYPITPKSIQRTNNFHDITSNDKIISATNIRNKWEHKQDITPYIPEGHLNNIDYNKLFLLVKYRIITEDHLEGILTVDEGMENKLKKVINEVNDIEELIRKIKSKRYTYNRIRRMLIHILLNVKKTDRLNHPKIEYIRILGFNAKGQEYLRTLKDKSTIPLITKLSNIKSPIKDYEINAALIYELLTNDKVMPFELSNKPIIKK